MPTSRQWRILPWVVVLVSAALGLSGLRAPTQENQEEHTFAYADVIATHQRAFEAIDSLDASHPTILTAWPMTVELRSPYLGYVDHPTETLHIDYIAENPDQEIDAVLVPVSSRHGPSLRRHAGHRGFKRVGRYQVGSAPALELYAP